MPWSVLRCLNGLIRVVGVVGAAKTVMKLMTPSRLFYGVKCGRDIAHYGWITKGKCNFYPVEPEAVVVGPVETAPAFRGRGLATVGLTFVLRVMAGKGCRLFYIDTAATNFPMQRVIEKCGFGKPVSSYERPEEGL
jgi:GNAT superfamily N-acetyltransferase